MNPIRKAVYEMRARIPRQILEKVFVDGSRYYRNNLQTSLEEQIETLVIRPRVLVDCNLIGGQEVLVPLAGLVQERPLDYTTVINIPKDRTQGRSINSVLNVTFFNSAAIAGYVGAGVVGMGSLGGGTGYNGRDNSAMTATAASVMAAMDKIPMTSTSRVQLIAENTILIRDGINIPDNSFLRCVVASDENLSGLPMRAYRYFSQLVEYAVKAYIYTELIIELDAGELRYGQNLGIFKEIVSSYADANQNYVDYLSTTMEKVFLQSDDETQARFLKLIMGGPR